MRALSTTQRFCNSVFGAPSASNSLAYGLMVDVEFSSPFRSGHGSPMKGDVHVSSGVGRLLQFGCPSTISRLVVSVVVDAVNRMGIARALSHVSKKVFECLPRVANRNSATPVVGIADVVWVLAPIFHIFPSIVSSGGPVVDRPTVNKSITAGRFFFKAPAGRGFPANEVDGFECFQISTTTRTYPLGSSFPNARNVVFGATDYSESSESLTSKVFCFTHSALLNVKHLMVHGKQRCSCDSGATLAMQGAF